MNFGNGSSSSDDSNIRRNVRVTAPMSGHVPSQADFLDNSQTQNDMFPPAPVATSRPSKSNTDSLNRSNDFGSYMGPMAANSVLGGSFGSMF